MIPFGGADQVPMDIALVMGEFFHVPVRSIIAMNLYG